MLHFDVLLTVHLGITLVNDQPDARLLYFIIQGGSNMTGTDLCVRLYKSVPVIFVPPCNYNYFFPRSPDLKPPHSQRYVGHILTPCLSASQANYVRTSNAVRSTVQHLILQNFCAVFGYFPYLPRAKLYHN